MHSALFRTYINLVIKPFMNWFLLQVSSNVLSGSADRRITRKLPTRLELVREKNMNDHGRGLGRSGFKASQLTELCAATNVGEKSSNDNPTVQKTPKYEGVSQSKQYS